MSAASQTSAEPQGVFSARIVLALVLTGVFAFCAYLVLSTYAPDLRGGQDGGAHALSSSATGYAGVVRLLRLVSRDTEISRKPSALGSAPNGMVLTPGRPMTSEDLKAPAGERLIVLPKWLTTPDPDHPGWVMNAGAIPVDRFAKFAPDQLGDLAVSRRSGPAASPRLSAGSLPGWPAGGLIVGPIHGLQTVSGPKLIPFVQDERGATVLAQVRGTRVFVLADPDLINTQGIRDRATARAAVLLLSQLGAGDRPLLFDVTLNGIASSHGLLKLALEPPFLGATLSLAIMVGLIGVQAWSRFGPAARPARVIALGKTALVENGAGMIRLAKREPKMALRYVRLSARAIKALGADDLPEPAQDAFLDRWADRVGASERISALLDQAAQVKTTAELTPLAQRTRQWRREMTREPE